MSSLREMDNYMKHDKAHKDKRLAQLFTFMPQSRQMNAAIGHFEQSVEHVAKLVDDGILLAFAQSDGTLRFDDVAKEIDVHIRLAQNGMEV